jgi:hypothetical protein
MLADEHLRAFFSISRSLVLLLHLSFLVAVATVHAFAADGDLASHSVLLCRPARYRRSQTPYKVQDQRFSLVSRGFRAERGN